MGHRVTWSCMNKDVTQWVKDCQTCSRAKVTRQPVAALQPIPVPQQRFSHIHVDIVGPLPVSREGFRYLFTIMDRSCRLLEAVPLTNIETETCRDALISQWVARFGTPHLRPGRPVHLRAVGATLRRYRYAPQHHHSCTCTATVCSMFGDFLQYECSLNLEQNPATVQCSYIATVLYKIPQILC